MIKRISVRNYGPFEHAELALEPLTVIVGPNASGKSIALKALLDPLAGKLPEAAGDVLAPMRKRGSEASAVELGWETHEGHGFALGYPSDTRAATVSKELKYMPKAILLRLEAEVMRQASYLDSPEPFLRADGYGLATVLADMKLSDTRGFTSILDQTKAIVPTFEDVRFKRSMVREGENKGVYGYELIFDMKNAPNLPPAAASDGTLLVLGLLTLLFGYSKREEHEDRGLLFLIDELEQSLHPRALGELITQLRQLTQETDVQILATSHSPYLVDWLKPEEVRITGLLDDGSATIRELGDHPEFDRWKEEMTPGEFWSTVGEDWS